MYSAGRASHSALYSDEKEHLYDSISLDPGQFLLVSDIYSSDAVHTHNLILSTQLWVYSIQHNPDRYDMTQPLIIAITYLQVYNFTQFILQMLIACHYHQLAGTVYLPD